MDHMPDCTVFSEKEQEHMESGWLCGQTLFRHLGYSILEIVLEEASMCKHVPDSVSVKYDTINCCRVNMRSVGLLSCRGTTGTLQWKQVTQRISSWGCSSVGKVLA